MAPHRHALLLLPAAPLFAPTFRSGRHRRLTFARAAGNVSPADPRRLGRSRHRHPSPDSIRAGIPPSSGKAPYLLDGLIIRFQFGSTKSHHFAAATESILHINCIFENKKNVG
jgi:hypothetical protein